MGNSLKNLTLDQKRAIMSAVNTIIGNHVIPVNDESEHLLQDWCDCNPTEQITANGVMWIHHPFDMRDLLEQAEIIRKIESLDLWDAEDKRDPKRLIQVYPLDADEDMVLIPPPAARK